MADELILIVDDEAVQREVLGGFLRKKQYRTAEAGGVVEGIALFGSEQPDLVLTDYRMPDGNGLEVLEAVRGRNPEVPVILITAYATIEGAVEAMRGGAFDYVTKPVKLDALDKVVGNALRHRRVRSESRVLTEGARSHTVVEGIVAESAAMQEVLSVAGKSSASDATVLVLGETGTGKEVVARAIHAASGRRTGPFVPVNCAALAEGVLESELFGHEKGAFTGADTQRAGRFEEAEGGTLFLDEVGDIPASVQVKLLRVIQEGTFERVGSSQPVRTDARLIAATHRDLEDLVRKGRFREDLYYRLNVIPVRVPALRNRREDIQPLASLFLGIYARRNGRDLAGFTRQAIDVLVSHDYPGNVRELENAIERGVVLAAGKALDLEDLPEAMRRGARPGGAPDLPAEGSLPDRLEAIERQAIVEALDKANGVQSRAARLLGINERNLRYKLKKYGLK